MSVDARWRLLLLCCLSRMEDEEGVEQDSSSWSDTCDAHGATQLDRWGAACRKAD